MLAHHELLSSIIWIDTPCHELHPLDAWRLWRTSPKAVNEFSFSIIFIFILWTTFHYTSSVSYRCHLSRCDSVTDWLWQFTGLSFTTNPPLCYLKEKAYVTPYHIILLCMVRRISTSLFFGLLDASQRKQGIGKISRIGWVVLRVITTCPDHLKIGFFIVVAFGIPRIAEIFRLE